MSSIDRRQMFRASAASIAGLGAVAHTVTHAAPASAAKITLADGAVVLFQGDSITDAGRARKAAGANDIAALGNGYPRLIAADLLRDYPAQNLQIYNRGISGNKVPDLQSRWQADCLDLKPNVLSILIGVNDIWHMLNGSYDGTVEDYQNGLRALLTQTKTALPDVHIVTCEPFVLRCGAVNDDWFPEFTNRLSAARAVADEMSLTRVPFQDMFDEAAKIAKPEYWAADGVHPTLAGHALMAKTWRDVVGV